jgi:hypothetical protein
MEGFSKVTYKNKQILFIDYSIVGANREKVIELLKAGTAEYTNQPKKSVLGLTNVTGVRFDMEMLKIFQDEGNKAAPYEKKVAVMGAKGLLKAGFNFVALTKPNYKTFDTEQEAKDWLVMD